jgi:protease I
VTVVGPETGEALTVNSDLEESDSYEVEQDVAESDADDYDALVVPGGTVGADTLRSDDDAVDLLAEHVGPGSRRASSLTAPGRSSRPTSSRAGR